MSSNKIQSVINGIRSYPIISGVSVRYRVDKLRIGSWSWSWQSLRIWHSHCKSDHQEGCENKLNHKQKLLNTINFWLDVLTRALNILLDLPVTNYMITGASSGFYIKMGGRKNNIEDSLGNIARPRRCVASPRFTYIDVAALLIIKEALL